MEPQSNEPGIYTLILYLETEREIKVGSLGVMSFSAGYYSYTGSARGSGGLKRVDRHLQVLFGQKNIRRWHIDYLLPNTRFQELFIIKTMHDLECHIARSISRRLLPMKGFGCTDCNCVSHLYYSNDLQKMREAVSTAHDCLD
jgi:Uri superfamily endonuclease